MSWQAGTATGLVSTSSHTHGASLLTSTEHSSSRITVGDTSFTSTFPTGSEADKAILIVERQLQSLSRRLTRCETDVASARTLYQHALQGHEASLRSANSGEIEHSRVALATREQEMHQALERRNAASDAVSSAKQRLRQLVSAQEASELLRICTN